MRRRVTGGRPRRGRTGSGGFGRSLVVGESWLGAPGLRPKEKLGVGIKKAQNGIKTKNISITNSAGSEKKLVFCLMKIPRNSSRRQKKKEGKA